MNNQPEADWLTAILDELVTTVHNLTPGDVGSMDRVLVPIEQAKAAINQHFEDALGEDKEVLKPAFYRDEPTKEWQREKLRREVRDIWYNPRPEEGSDDR